MANKILRPIVDVEIVEQMTENDTVLIEQNGEIKRTKGVVSGSCGGSAGDGGSGEKYIIEATFDGNGDQVFSWRDPVDFSTFANAISNEEWPDVMVVSIYDGIVAGVTIPTGIMFADPELSGIVFVTWDYQILFSNDGSLKRTYG